MSSSVRRSSSILRLVVSSVVSNGSVVVVVALVVTTSGNSGAITVVVAVGAAGRSDCRAAGVHAASATAKTEVAAIQRVGMAPCWRTRNQGEHEALQVTHKWGKSPWLHPPFRPYVPS